MKKQIVTMAAGLLLATTVQAHPGHSEDVLANGCHICTSHCDYWGEQPGSLHCHDEAHEDTSRKGYFDAGIEHGHIHEPLLKPAAPTIPGTSPDALES